MTQAEEFKITYTTLASPAEEVHVAFERAAEEIKEAFGGTHPMWIDGNPVSGVGTFDNRSPADSRILLGSFQTADRKQIGEAIAAADRAFYDWSRTPWADRISVLREAADVISARRFELAALMSIEVGKTRFESLADVEESADLIR
ncbi:MAG: aldehyde dehydrogenase family protein, partial [Thermoanaerobaculia bacterium]